MAGRPRTAIGTYGSVAVRRRGNRAIAARTAEQARSTLKRRLLSRPGFDNGGVLKPSSSFVELAELWLADLDLRDLATGTKQNYCDQLRLHVRPAFEHYTLGEITTGRVEWFLKEQAAFSQSRAKQSRTLLNLMFAFALRHDAIARNPVEGTSPLRRRKEAPRALTLEQIAAIRAAAATWRTGPGLPGPKNDGQARDIIEILLGTALRPGEVLALRSRDITDGQGRGVGATFEKTVEGKVSDSGS